MTDVTCRLTAKNRDQPLNPTVGNRVWDAFVLSRWVGACVRCRFVTWSGVPVMSARIKPPLVSACSEPLPGAAAAVPPPPRHVKRTISSLQQTVATQNARIAQLEQKLGDLDELLARCVRV